MADNLLPSRTSVFLSILIGSVLLLLVYIFFANPRILPNSAYAHRTKLYNLWQNMQYEELVEFANSTIQKHPLDRDVVMLRGFSQFYLFFELPSEQRTDELLDACIQDLRTMILLDGTSVAPEVLYVLAKAYYYKGNDYFRESITYFERAQAKGIDALDSYEYLGLLYEASEQVEKSINIFKQAIEKDKKDIYYIKLAEALLVNEQYEDALRTYEHVIETSTDPAMLLASHLALAEQLLVEDDIEAVEKHLDAAFAIDSNADTTHVLRGNLYLKLGESERARYEWRKALQNNPHNAEALRRLEGF